MDEIASNAATRTIPATLFRPTGGTLRSYHAASGDHRSLSTGRKGYGLDEVRGTVSAPRLVSAVQSPVYCLSCKYDLRNLNEHRCPECGRPFDPGDDRTFSVPSSRMSRIALIGLFLLTVVAWGIVLPLLLWAIQVARAL